MTLLCLLVYGGRVGKRLNALRDNVMKLSIPPSYEAGLQVYLRNRLVVSALAL